MTKRVLASVALAAGLSWLASPAHAVFQVDIFDNSSATGLTVVDNGANDLNPTAGLILFNGTVGNFSINTVSVLSNAGTGEPFSVLETNIHITDYQGGATGSIGFSVTSTDYAAPLGPLFITDDFSLTGIADQVDYETYIDLANTAFGTGTLIHSGTALTVLDDDFESLNGVNAALPYSLSQFFTLTHSTATQSTSMTNTTLVNIPEPTTLGIVGGGLLCLGAMRRRRRA